VHRECKFLRICFCSCHIIPLGRENYAPPGQRNVPSPSSSPLIESSRRESDSRFGLRRRSGNASKRRENTVGTTFLFSIPCLPLPLFKHLSPRCSSFGFELRAAAARLRSPFSLASFSENARFMRVQHRNRRMDFLSAASRGLASTRFHVFVLFRSLALIVQSPIARFAGTNRIRIHAVMYAQHGDY